MKVSEPMSEYTADEHNKKPWHSKVYADSQDEIPDNWKQIRQWVLIRDNHICYRCGQKGGRNLTVHHIIPRSVGGTYEMENLITLCSPCHDFVELEEFRTLAEIAASMTDEEKERSQEEEENSHRHRVEHFERPEWHKWVYGGHKNPK